ncbi:hypothetical protein [Paenibacillus sp. NEAU-GSW1]|uniref:hypothetical protein n=1 Tax=Paenibacillus sp. NEAU-GSW1 TaxID=2682486 RepID=UPI0012E235A9|nr:hypothetical protein [Paenibacillus sp. NEAU-GSW1]MUT64919.1 hypothetical protein [Paenibacillus sp. NEAU-GSW1]
MTLEQFRRYVELFSQFYKDGKVGAKWGREQVYFRPTIDLDEELPKIDSTFSEEEFVDVAFIILKVVRDLSNGVSSKNIDEAKIQIISEIFLNQNEDVLEHARIRSTSVINTFEEIDYEIATKRSKEDPNYIIGTSVILSLVYNDSIKPDSNHRFALELSTKELKEIVKVLEEAVDTIKKIDR